MNVQSYVFSYKLGTEGEESPAQSRYCSLVDDSIYLGSIPIGVCNVPEDGNVAISDPKHDIFAENETTQVGGFIERASNFLEHENGGKVDKDDEQILDEEEDYNNGRSKETEEESIEVPPLASPFPSSETSIREKPLTTVLQDVVPIKYNDNSSELLDITDLADSYQHEYGIGTQQANAKYILEKMLSCYPCLINGRLSTCEDHYEVKKAELLAGPIMGTNLIVDYNNKSILCLTCGGYMDSTYSVTNFASIIFDPVGLFCSIRTHSTSLRIDLVALLSFRNGFAMLRNRDWKYGIVMRDEVVYRDICVMSDSRCTFYIGIQGSKRILKYVMVNIVEPDRILHKWKLVVISNVNTDNGYNITRTFSMLCGMTKSCWAMPQDCSSKVTFPLLHMCTIITMPLDMANGLKVAMPSTSFAPDFIVYTHLKSVQGNGFDSSEEYGLNDKWKEKLEG